MQRRSILAGREAEGSLEAEGFPGQKRGRAAWLKFAGLLLLLGALASIAWTGGAGRWVNPERIEEVLRDFGVLAPAIYILMMTGAVVISPIPSLPLDAAAGAVFGPLWGTVYSVAGAEAGALIGFYISRILGREAIARLFRRDIAFCDLCAERHLVYFIFVSRLLPFFSFDLISYGAGLTRISVGGFAAATLLGMIPPTFAFNYFGSGIFSAGGLPMAMGGGMVLMFFLLPVWIKRRNPWGLYDKMSGG